VVRAVRSRFRSAAGEARFLAAYRAVLARWPVAVESLDVPGAYGVTHVQACGPDGGTPLVLLPGGGATSAAWFATAGELSRTHRVYAVDPIRDGLSVPGARRVRGTGGVVEWLDGLFAGLGLEQGAGLCGHSYGGWMALTYALHAPGRVRRLALLDPTCCFAGLRLGYRLRAVPLLARPTAARAQAFLRWETGGAPLDPDWLALFAAGAAEVRSSLDPLPRRPSRAMLAASEVPTLVLLAERSRAHHAGRVARRVGRLMPSGRAVIVPGATHHTMPTENADRLSRELQEFFG
jgi:pimeloyl-ACP methyl ester carboxylesterase